MNHIQTVVFSVLLLASPALACDGCLVIWASPVWATLLLICGFIAWKKTRVFESLPSRASLLLLSFFGGVFALTLFGGLGNVLVGFLSLGPVTLLTAALLMKRKRGTLQR